MQMYFRLLLVPAENNVCELESEIDFSDVKTFVLLLTNKIHC